METGQFYHGAYNATVFWVQPNTTQGWLKMLDWCVEIFGPMQVDSWTVSLHANRILFYYEQDRTAFLLRWS